MPVARDQESAVISVFLPQNNFLKHLRIVWAEKQQSSAHLVNQNGIS
jgi:hypothetical protein